MGEKSQLSMLNRASLFLLSPKPVKRKKDKTESNKNQPFNHNNHIRIGNLTFEKPNNKVWTDALSVAEDLTDTVIHITMEQRQSYILQQN
jgi:hypothetical protein